MSLQPVPESVPEKEGNEAPSGIIKEENEETNIRAPTGIYIIRNRARKWPQYCAGYGAAMGGFNVGAVLGWSSAGVEYVKERRGARPAADAWIASIVCLGAVTSLLVSALLLDRIGRKWTMLASVPVLLAGWTALGAVETDTLLMAARFVLGMGVGSACVAAPLYAAEIAHKEMRGVIGVAFHLCFTLGILYSFVLALLHDYQMLCMLNMVPAGLFAAWMLVVPDSPYFLLRTGREDSARAALQWLRGRHYDIEEEFDEIRTTVMKTTRRRKSLFDLLLKLSFRRALVMATLLMICQQTSGINAVLFNLKAIITAAGVTTCVSPDKQAFLVAMMQVLASSLSILLVERFGRRRLMMSSMVTMGVFHMGLVVYFTVRGPDLTQFTALAMAWMPLFCLIGYIMAFSVGAGPVPWCMLGEIFPDECKAMAASAVAIFCWLLSFVMTWTFEFLKQSIAQYLFFLFFALSCFSGTVAVYLFMVETRNRSQKEIQAIMKGTSPEMAPIGLR